MARLETPVFSAGLFLFTQVDSPHFRACFFFNQFTEGAYGANGAAIGGRHGGAVYGLMNTGANLMGFINALLLSTVAALLGWKIAIAMGAVFAVLAIVFILLSRADHQMDQAD